MNRWAWRAYYEDGSTISQGDLNPDTGKEWSSDHLPMENLKCLALETMDGQSPRILVQRTMGMRINRFWRRYFNASSGDDMGTCWVVELQPYDVPYSMSFFAFFRPDGTYVLSTDSEASEFNV